MPWGPGAYKRARSSPIQEAAIMSDPESSAAKEGIQHDPGLPQNIGSRGLQMQEGWPIRRADGALKLIVQQEKRREHVGEIIIRGRLQQSGLGCPEGRSR